MPLHPSTAQFFHTVNATLPDNPELYYQKLNIADFRQSVKFFHQYMGNWDPNVGRDNLIPMRDNYQQRIKIFNEHLEPTIIMIPGGGYVLDLFDVNAVACARMAEFTQAKIILLNYRITPDVPLSTTFNDIEDSIKYLITPSENYFIDPNDVILAGFSAGAHGALCAAQHLKNVVKFKRLILHNGFYDMSFDNKGFREFEKQDLLCDRRSGPRISEFYGLSKNVLFSPPYSPLNSDDFANLPPISIITCQYDGLCGDSEDLYALLKIAGVDVEKLDIRGHTHDAIILRDVMSDGDDPAEIIARAAGCFKPQPGFGL